jgi:hypothetical protein
MKKTSTKTETVTKPHPNGDVVSAERCVDRIATACIQKELSYSFMIGQTPEDADKERVELERNVLIAMAYQAANGQPLRTIAQNCALVIARSFAAIKTDASQAGLVARMRIRGIQYGLQRIDEVIARMEALRVSFKDEMAALEDVAASEEEYQAFRMSRE